MANPRMTSGCSTTRSLPVILSQLHNRDIILMTDGPMAGVCDINSPCGCRLDSFLHILWALLTRHQMSSLLFNIIHVHHSPDYLPSAIVCSFQRSYIQDFWSLRLSTPYLYPSIFQSVFLVSLFLYPISSIVNGTFCKYHHSVASPRETSFLYVCVDFDSLIVVLSPYHSTTLISPNTLLKGLTCFLRYLRDFCQNLMSLYIGDQVRQMPFRDNRLECHYIGIFWLMLPRFFNHLCLHLLHKERYRWIYDDMGGLGRRRCLPFCIIGRYHATTFSFSFSFSSASSLFSLPFLIRSD